MSYIDQSFNANQACIGFCDNRRKHSYQNTSYHSSDDGGMLLLEQNVQKKQDIDNLLSEALNALTFHEREEQQEVLHGVDKVIAEGDDFIANSLVDLDTDLMRIKAGSAYEIAERMDPTYATSRAFRVMFLRANRYDVKASANQMLLFFELKQQLFGNDKLAKDITIDDLDENDLEALKAGAVQLAGRDTANRKIYIQLPGIRKFKYIQNELRSRFLITMQALRSEQTQLKGAVSILYSVGDFKDRCNGAGFVEHTKFALAVPQHSAGSHICFDDPNQYMVIKAGLSVLNAKFRARVRVHYGSHLECQYLLSTYGILTNTLPLTTSHGVNLSRHLDWVESCLRDSKDSAFTSPAGIKPNADDVLFMGYKTSSNLGNARLREGVKEIFLQYRAGSQEQKRLLIDGLIAQIHNSGGRFLKQDKESIWHEATLKESRTKVMKIISNYKRRLGTPRSTISPPSSIIGEPMPEDVIFGRNQHSRGNELLHHLVKERFEEYESLDRGMKMSLVDSIAKTIRDEGGRFLGPESNGWVELSIEQYRVKLSKYLTNHRRHFKKGGKYHTL
ncbi:unnamed protein product [Cylindrotheca closterium]|uniref:DUF6824 domain-containing protein n=1 Tax=Cylindrotheca closterium TaxID=2856 RepID=A0AAD2FHS1_9STRA|nr:unnamed protein product [Cylindrotheca closterium]